MGKITIIDDIYCKASQDLWPVISRLMEYPGEHWRQGPYGRIKQKTVRSFLDKRGGKFLCGFLPRIKLALTERDLTVEYDGERQRLDPPFPFPELRNPIEGLRSDQLHLQTELAIRAVKAQHGVILAPTGTGKTVIAMLITSMFYDESGPAKILFLCHTIDLLMQTKEAFESQGFSNITLIGGGQDTKLNPRAIITIATVQTFSKIPMERYCDAFDVLLVDEAHHCNSVDSQFGYIVSHCIAPVKIGFTATVPKEREAALALEGIIGPVVGKVTIQQGVELKIMAKPIVRLISVPYNPVLGEIRKYADLYRDAIVNGRARNTRIAEAAISLAQSGNTVLIVVKEITHGKNLLDILNLRRAKCTFVQGQTPGETRERAKKLLNEKKIPIVICTAVWKEGVNIPSLNCVINACGGKSEIATLQAVGRGLRSIPGKDTLIIYDFLDPYRYLAQHAIQRLSIYVEAGWL